MLQFIRDLLPKENVLPENTYQAKKIVCSLGLEVEKIHACRKDCMLFRNDDANLDECRICGSSRYKRSDNIDGSKMGENNKVKKVPAKVAWYFLVIPRLK